MKPNSESAVPRERDFSTRNYNGQEARFREKVRAQQRIRLEQLKLAYQQEGKYPFEGQWLSREAIMAAYQTLRRQDRQLFVEIIVLLAAGAGLAGACLGLVYYLCYV